jgi:uncharacterized protein (TIGR00299 family) protein
VKVAYFDCPSGVAGDMILGALVDAGLPFEILRDRLGGLRLPGYTLERREVMKGAFRATKIDVRVGGRASAPGGHPHRDLPAILRIIAEADLPPAVKEAASRVFTRLAEAEGRVHGMPPEGVRFHDVGAVDAIVDVAGSCIGLDWLGVTSVHCSALPIGGGTVKGPHGPMPVPAPGTAELLKGFPIVDTGVKRELVTPTGAAILTTLATDAGSMPSMTVGSIGYGAGAMDLDTPNVLRVFLGEVTGPAEIESIVQVETTVDDMSPQLYEPLMERLFEAGALDVHLTPVLMKKSRPGVVVTALCAPDAVGALARACFLESTTIGVRWTSYRRSRLPREMVTLATSLGELSYKVSRLDGRVVTVTPEFDEVRRIAGEKGLAVRDALEQARVEGRRLVD